MENAEKSQKSEIVPAKPSGARQKQPSLKVAHKKFLKVYFANGFDATHAARSIGASNSNARRLGQQILQIPRVQSEIQAAISDMGINKLRVSQEIAEMAFATPDGPWSETKNFVNLKLKGLEWAKQMAGFDSEANEKPVTGGNQQPLVNLLVENPDNITVQSVVGLPNNSAPEPDGE